MTVPARAWEQRREQRSKVCTSRPAARGSRISRVVPTRLRAARFLVADYGPGAGSPATRLHQAHGPWIGIGQDSTAKPSRAGSWPWGGAEPRTKTFDTKTGTTNGKSYWWSWLGRESSCRLRVAPDLLRRHLRLYQVTEHSGRFPTGRGTLTAAFQQLHCIGGHQLDGKLVPGCRWGYRALYGPSLTSARRAFRGALDRSKRKWNAASSIRMHGATRQSDCHWSAVQENMRCLVMLFDFVFAQYGVYGTLPWTHRMCRLGTCVQSFARPSAGPSWAKPRLVGLLCRGARYAYPPMKA